MLPTKIDMEASLKKKSAFARAVERFSAMQEQRRRRARVGFLIDATASREDTWEKAQTIQAKMFRAAAKTGPLSLRLVHFGGGALSDHGWTDDLRKAAAAIAGARCVSGYTQFLPGLSVFLDEPPETRAAAIVMIGDCFEENPAEAERIALALKQAGIRVFCFHEGEDWTAEVMFRRIAGLTGGAFAQFGESLPLGALCEGVAVLAAGGPKAVKRLANKRVRQLLLTGPSSK